MPLVSESDVEKALSILADEEGAAARASHEFYEALSKSLLSQLMNEAPETTEAARERWARSHEKYKRHLAEVKRLAQIDYAWRAKYDAADAKVRIWQTSSANNRRADNLR